MQLFGTNEAGVIAQSLEVSDLVELYRQAKKRFDEDTVFQETSRKEVVNLQVRST